MGEVLTQSQIDALLNSVSTHEVGQEQIVFGDISKKERKYDFRTPKKFTKDSLKLLDSVYSNYARVISSHLTSILRLSCEVDLIDIEEQNFGEFSNALNENDILSIVHIDVANASHESDPVMMQISNTAAYAMMDRMLGGAGVPMDDELMEFTDIEIALYTDLVKHIVPLMNDAWKNYFDIKFKFSNVEVNPRLMQTLSMDDVVVIIVLNVTLGDISGKINICLPGNAFDIILKTFENNKSFGKRRDNQVEKAANDILYNISGGMLNVKVNLGEAQILLSDILDLQEGDVIKLNKPKQSDAVVCIEDKPWFTAELGTQKQNIAVKITGFAANL